MANELPFRVAVVRGLVPPDSFVAVRRFQHLAFASYYLLFGVMIVGAAFFIVDGPFIVWSPAFPRWLRDIMLAI